MTETSKKAASAAKPARKRTAKVSTLSVAAEPVADEALAIEPEAPTQAPCEEAEVDEPLDFGSVLRIGSTTRSLVPQLTDTLDLGSAKVALGAMQVLREDLKAALPSALFDEYQRYAPELPSEVTTVAELRVRLAISDGWLSQFVAQVQESIQAAAKEAETARLLTLGNPELAAMLRSGNARVMSFPGSMASAEGEAPDAREASVGQYL